MVNFKSKGKNIVKSKSKHGKKLSSLNLVPQITICHFDNNQVVPWLARCCFNVATCWHYA